MLKNYSFESIINDMQNDDETQALDFKEMCENDFFDSEFPDEELPDWLFQKQAPRFGSDVAISVQKVNPIVGDKEASVYNFYNYDNETIEMGSKYVEPLKYYIDHDITIVDPVLFWYLQYTWKQSEDDFPFVEIADPIIDSQMMKPDKIFMVQAFFMTRGSWLVDPTYSELDQCAKFGGMMSKVPKKMELQLDLKGKEVFYSYRDCPEEYRSKCNYVAMQFNPIHPMAYKHIREIEHKFGKYKGKYEWNNKEMHFEYDYFDSRYRIHSDIWQQIVGEHQSYQVFDLVSNYDFVPIMNIKSVKIVMNLKADGTYELPDASVQTKPIFIDPYTTTREPMSIYSAIGPWEGDIRRGVGRHFRVPYLTSSFRKAEYHNNYKDISRMMIFSEEGVLKRKHCDKCEDKYYDDAPCVCEGLEKKEKFERYEDIMDFYYMRDSKVAYAPSNDGDREFIYFPGAIEGYPKNSRGSLIYSLNYLNLMNVFNMKNYIKIFEYAPLTISKFVSTMTFNAKEDPVHNLDKYICDVDRMCTYERRAVYHVYTGHLPKEIRSYLKKEKMVYDYDDDAAYWRLVISNKETIDLQNLFEKYRIRYEDVDEVEEIE